MIRLRFTYDEAKLLQEVKSKDTGSKIFGVHFEDNKIIATDGQRLLMLDKKYPPSLEGKTLTIDFELQPEETAVYEKKMFRIYNKKRVQVDKYKPAFLEGFPDWKTVIPKDKIVYDVTIDGDIIPAGYDIRMYFSDRPKAVIKAQLIKSEDLAAKPVNFIFMPKVVVALGEAKGLRIKK